MKFVGSVVAGLAALATIASATPIRIISSNDPAFETFAHATPQTLRKSAKIGTFRPAAADAHDWSSWVPSMMDAQPAHHREHHHRPHREHSDLPEWMSRIIAPSRHRHDQGHTHGIVITTHVMRPDGSIGEAKDMSPYVMGFGNPEAINLDGEAASLQREWHHKGEHHERRKCWKGRFFRAMSSLNPVELYAVCFVFGAGLGSLARVFFVLFVLLRRSHAYLNEPTATASSSVAAARVGAVVVVNERDAKDQEEKSGLIANVDADDDEELPAYQERSVTARH